jgi:hypothetical protein
MFGIMKNSITIISLALLISLISCKKEAQKSNMELLCGKYWKITALISDFEISVHDDNGNVIGHNHDYYSALSVCATDDLFLYNADSTYSWDAKTLCTDEQPGIGTGTWVFKDNETTIRQIQDNNGFKMEYNDVKLSDSKFTCTIVLGLPDTTYQLAATFTAQ